MKHGGITCVGALEDSSRFDDSDDSSIVLFFEPKDDIIDLSSDEDKTTSKPKPLVFTPTKAVKTKCHGGLENWKQKVSNDCLISYVNLIIVVVVTLRTMQ